MAACYQEHTFIKSPKPQDGRWSKIVLLQKDPFFVCVSCHFFFHFQSISSPNHGQTYTVLHTYFFISFLFLKTTPTSNPKGGHALHASFSYWDMPTSGPKRGGACA